MEDKRYILKKTSIDNLKVISESYGSFKEALMKINPQDASFLKTLFEINYEDQDIVKVLMGNPDIKDFFLDSIKLEHSNFSRIEKHDVDSFKNRSGTAIIGYLIDNTELLFFDERKEYTNKNGNPDPLAYLQDNLKEIRTSLTRHSIYSDFELSDLYYLYSKRELPNKSEKDIDLLCRMVEGSLDTYVNSLAGPYSFKKDDYVSFWDREPVVCKMEKVSVSQIFGKIDDISKNIALVRSCNSALYPVEIDKLSLSDKKEYEAYSVYFNEKLHDYMENKNLKKDGENKITL